MFRQISWFIVLSVAATSYAAGCNGGAETASGGTTDRAMAEPAPTQTPRSLKTKIVGQWDMPLSVLISTLPPEKRADVAALDFVFRDAEPTEEEVKASGLDGIKGLGIALMRNENQKNPSSEKLTKMRAAYDNMNKALPSMEITENTLVLRSKAKQEISTYTVLRENPENIVLKVVDNDDGEVEELTFTLADENTLVVSQSGDPDMTFYRHGAPRPATPAQQAPDLRENPAAAAIFGRWRADDHAGEISLLANGSYIIHGGGGDTTGRWRVDTIESSRFVIRTSLGSSFALTSDTINIVANEDGSIVWTNTGTNSTSRYTKVQ